LHFFVFFDFAAPGKNQKSTQHVFCEEDEMKAKPKSDFSITTKEFRNCKQTSSLLKKVLVNNVVSAHPDQVSSMLLLLLTYFN